MLEIRNADAVIRQLERWEAELYELTRQVALGYTIQAYKAVLANSAQFSGDFAANWKYSLNQPDYSFTPDALGGSVAELFRGTYRREGHRQAIEYALGKARPVAKQFALGDTVYFTNSAAHDEPYARKIEENKIKFRAGNTGQPVKRMVDQMRITTVIDKNLARILRRQKL